jgi:hypothetical protein
LKTSTKEKIMLLKIKFCKETRFVVPSRQTIRSWTQLLSGTRLSIRSLVMAERPKAGRRGTD